MIHLFAFIIGIHPAFAVRTDSAAPFFAFDRKLPANCEHRFVRIDRLRALELFFPKTAPAFRRAFHWMKVGEGTNGQLIGYPRRQVNHAPFFVIVPLHVRRELPVLIINVDINRPLVAKTFHRAVSRLDGVLTSDSHYTSEIEGGVRYAARSEDFYFYDRPGTALVPVNEGFALATRMAELVPLRAPNVRPVRSRPDQQIPEP